LDYYSTSIDFSPSGLIAFLPGGRTAELDGEKTLLDLARTAGVELTGPCSGKGTCGKCKIRILDGEAPLPDGDETALLTDEEARAGIRLACYIRPEGPMKIGLAAKGEEGHRIQSDGIMNYDFVAGEGLARKELLRVEKPSLHDSRAAAERVAAAAGRPLSPLFLPGLLRALPPAPAEGDYFVTVTVSGGAVIAIEPGDTRNRFFGAAVDIGTTTVVVSIVDMNTGDEIAAAAAPNAQRGYGEDVISRILYTTEAAGNKAQLQRLILEQLDILIAEASAAAGAGPGEISAIAIAANTSMLHLLLGVDGRSIAVAPFAPAFVSFPPVPAASIGLQGSPGAILALIPSISSYVGGDITAGVLATGMDTSDETVMLIDIGTNGEIIFGNRNGFSSCSCAAGPALEGMNIACGIVASKGAVESVEADGNGLHIRTIDGAPPAGICGSGIVDAVAVLAELGIVGTTGRFAKVKDFEENERLAPYAKRFDAENKRFFLTEPGDSHEVYILQKDVRQVQLAKAAIAAAIEALLNETGALASDLDRVYIAGGFGRHLRLESLIRIGLIPAAFRDKVVFAGNTSKSGAALALLSPGAIEKAEALRAITRYYELSVYERYDELFIKEMGFPK
jgi:uncharacterized 2Fe-2S/4Fe-4S cluster protein (DUF4445 family)